MKLFNSRYNFCIPAGDGKILYNSKTGGTVFLSDQDSLDLLPFLTGKKYFCAAEDFEPSFLLSFIKNGFLVEEQRTELSEISEKYWEARGETPVVYTITTTMDCNLGCYYCFESRSKESLKSDDIPTIIAHVSNTFKESRKKSLHVDWFGGEPLLNFEFLKEASFALQNFCQNNTINYHASVVSNGTLWPSDVGKFITEHKIRQVQISFDGMKEKHDKIRRYRKQFDSGFSSFTQAVELVDQLLDHTRVDLRFNIGLTSENDLDNFMDFIIEKEWFKKRYPFVFQPARVSAYTERSSFFKEKQYEIEEFDRVRENVKQRLSKLLQVDESEVPYGFPFPKNYVCAALARNSHVIGADKSLHRCTLELGEKNLAVGHLNKSSTLLEANKNWWDQFDPCKLPSCSKCSFLPICFGGCAKKHFDQDQSFLDEQSIYWRNNLARIISSYIGKKEFNTHVFEEVDQFREGYDG